MRLYLLRHAEAEPDADTDAARALTATGWAQAAASADWLCGQVCPPAKVLVSPYRRAQETASVVVQALGLAAAETHPLLIPEGDVLRIEPLLAACQREGLDELIVVTHMPVIAALSSWLTEGVLTTDQPFALAEVRVLEADVVAPDLCRRVAGFIPDVPERSALNWDRPWEALDRLLPRR